MRLIEQTLVIIFLLVAICVLIVGLATVAMDAIEAYEGRSHGRRRSIEAEWRIQQIGSDARARMWDEVTRHRPDGGG